MATPTETNARGQGFGARRFLVRGADFSSEEKLAGIRPLITDYPERVPLVPGFPVAGRRGGSRPVVDAEALTAALRSSGSLYPGVKERSAGVVQGVAAGLSESQQAALLSPRGPGYARAGRLQLAAGATTVLPTVALPGPALMTRLDLSSDITAVVPFVDVGFRYSTDDNNTGGFATSGNRFFLAGSSEFDINLGLDTMVWTPNILVPFNKWFLKMIARNNQAGTINIVFTVSIEWL